METTLMIFDGDCAFCSSSARVLRKLTKNRIPIRPYQFLKLEEYELSSELTSKAVYFIDGETKFAAAEAIARFLIKSGTLWSLPGQLLLLPGVRSLAKRVYYWVAKYRHRLPGGTPECSLGS